MGRRRDLEAVSRARQLLPGECVDPKSSSLTHMTTVWVSGMVPLPTHPASVKSYGLHKPRTLVMSGIQISDYQSPRKDSL